MSILDRIRGVVGESTGTHGDEYSSHVVLMEVDIYEEIGKAATYLMEEKSIIINVKTSNDEDVQKVVSFLEGALFVIGGEMKQLDERTFLCVPNSVAIIDKETDELIKEDESMEEKEQTEQRAEESADLLDEEQENQQKQEDNV